ncbi:hypothetical protein ES319_A01G151400v1 [Gossypium barbadense]|uniref:Uncharacterized protein n=1 Tax=Gossypium barbadense TaxID=3634 RepID=A0A5J5X0V2_GOSBA|nr:hypothetical protein ES319_A01G151400v1 [Gossypium barbadense]
MVVAIFFSLIFSLAKHHFSSSKYMVGNLLSSSSCNPFNLLKDIPLKPYDDIFICKHSNLTKPPTSDGNKLISFPKNFKFLNRLNAPTDFEIKLNTFLYK